MRISNVNNFLLGNTQAKVNSTNNVEHPYSTNSIKLDALKADTVSFGNLVPKTASLTKKTIMDLPKDLSGQRVFLRVDHNVSFKPGTSIIESDTRIRRSLDTIIELIKRNAKIIIGTHMGDPYKVVNDKPGKFVSTNIVAERLAELLKERGINTSIKHIPEAIGENAVAESKALKNGDILYLENLRRDPAETGSTAIVKDGKLVSETDSTAILKDEEWVSKELPKDKMDAYAQELAKLGDHYVNDGFGAAHRAHASTSLIANYIPGQKVAGLLMNQEYTELSKLINNPKRPFVAMIGGSKVSDKIKIMDNLISNVLKKGDTLVIGGGMSYTFTLAKGGEIGKSLSQPGMIETAQAIMKKAKEKGIELILPVDNVVADRFSNDANAKIVSSMKIPNGYEGLDIGPKTVEKIKEALDKSKTVFWNGPLGVYEFPNFANGTNSIGQHLVKITKENSAYTVVGGGDASTAMKKAGIKGFSYDCTGGGASLEFMEGKELPGIKLLDNA